MPKERNAFFISESFVQVIQAFKDCGKSWLESYGKVLKVQGSKDLEAI